MFAICIVHVGTGAMLDESLDNFQSCALLLAMSGTVNDMLVIVYQIELSIVHEGSLDNAGIALSGTSHKYGNICVRRHLLNALPRFIIAFFVDTIVWSRKFNVTFLQTRNTIVLVLFIVNLLAITSATVYILTDTA